VADESILIMKIGGSCLRNAEDFDKIVQIIKNYHSRYKLVLVVSALSGVTDLLIQTAKRSEKKEDYNDLLNGIKVKHEKIVKEILKDYHIPVIEYLEDNIKEIEKRLEDCVEYGLSCAKLDSITSYGEILSTFILSNYLKNRGINTVYLPANSFLVTDDVYNDALPLFDITKKMVKYKVIPILEKGFIPIITGFIARNKEGHITTLGRGGSDFTATILAHCLKKDDNDVRIILWKDVSGVMTASPKFEPNAKIIDTLTYAEAKELAYFGAKLLHPRCIYAVEDLKIPIEIRNFDKETNEHTLIVDKREEHSIVTGLAQIENVAMITVEGEAMVSIPGTAAKIFDLMGANNINVLMISQASSENNITFLVTLDDGDRAKDLLIQSPLFGKKWFKIKRELNVSLVAVVGENMGGTPGVAGRIFSALGKKKINIRAIAQGSSEINVSFIILRKDLRRTINILAREFDLV